MVRLLRVLPNSIAETHAQARRNGEQARSDSSTGSNSVDDSVVYLGTFPALRPRRPVRLMRAKEWRARAQADLLLAKDQNFIHGADGVDLVQEEDEVNSPCPWERRSRGQAVQGNANPMKTVEGAFKERPVRALSTLAAPSCNGLLNVLVQLDGREVQATISTGTAHNFLAEKVARELGLTIVSNDTLEATGVADAEGALGRTEATLAIGPRKGRCSFSVFPLDGYQIILGLDLCTKAEIVIIPHRPGILVWANEVPTFVPASVWKPDA